jgi:hypothetical protein
MQRTPSALEMPVPLFATRKHDQERRDFYRELSVKQQLQRNELLGGEEMNGSGIETITQTQTSTIDTVCPVCGIAFVKEIAQPEFELHVHSHFTD